jgi:hypothetical protein
MIIKIKADDKYHIFDNVSKVDYYIKPKHSNSDGNIIEQIRDGDESITVQTSTDNPIKYNWISFEDKDGNKQSIIFDTVAYICNDNGKTIEIIRV